MAFAALLVLPNPRLRGTLSLLLLDHGCKVDAVSDLAEARRRLELTVYSVCVVARDLPEGGGEALLAHLLETTPESLRIGVGEGEVASDSDLPPEANARRLRELIDAAVAKRPLIPTREKPRPTPAVVAPPPLPEPRHYTTHSPLSKTFWHELVLAAEGDGNILLVGEPGCEFELAAREIVRLASGQDTGPIHLDHPHVQEETLRSLDSLARLSADPIQFIFINELPHLSQESRHHLQDHLLRRRAEATKPGTRIRFILAAPVEAPEVFLAASVLRDLTPLLGATLRLPALRDRPEDIALIARDTLFRLADLNPSQRPRRIDSASVTTLQAQLWRRNHEELVYVLRRAALSCTQRVLQATHLQPHLGRNPRTDNGTPVDFLMTAGSPAR